MSVEDGSYDIMQFNLGDYVLNAYSITVAALVGAIGFLIRKIFTNEKQIGVLESKLETMTENLQKDISELKDDIRYLTNNVARK